MLTATSPAAALKILAEQDVAVIVSDQRMPDMSGVELLRLAKEIHPDSVRIVLSGHADFDAISEAVNLGSIYKFLLKPWDSGVLGATIHEAFQHHALTVENRDLRHRASL
jgi:DNA-binding NtrC family response regulator